jgi:radical SAM superfamily enzyme YgiQ (UPF0313 family)
MRVKLVLPRFTRSQGEPRRKINYSLWPPIGLATLAGYVRADDEVWIEDENVEPLEADDSPDLVGISVSVSGARRAYEIADHYRRRGVHVCLGGLHATAMPVEALRHADTVFLGPAEEAWPRFLGDFRARRPRRVYRSQVRCLADQPPARRDLIKTHLYLAPNALVVSRGCPHCCDFCSNSSFFRGGKAFYTQTVDQAMAEIERLPGRHLYFLDDHILGSEEFARALFGGMKGMGRTWQSAATVDSALRTDLLNRAVASGLRTLLVGFETISDRNLADYRKHQNLKCDYEEAVRRFHDAGVMVNATFVFGLDDDDESVFERTVEWALAQGIETATFHILTPYPGTRLYQRMAAEDRILTRNWDLYDTAHVVFQPARMSAAQLKAGRLRAHRDFYGWGSILKSAATHARLRDQLRHCVYTAGWGRFEALWDLIIRSGQVGRFSPLLTGVLAASGGPIRSRNGRRPVEGHRRQVVPAEALPPRPVQEALSQVHRGQL